MITIHRNPKEGWYMMVKSRVLCAAGIASVVALSLLGRLPRRRFRRSTLRRSTSGRRPHGHRWTNSAGPN